MAELELGGFAMSWDPQTRCIEVRLTTPGARLGRAEAEQLLPMWRAAVGDPPAPYGLLVDAAGMVTADAHWRASAAELTVEHATVLSQAYYNADPEVRVSATMFLKATGGRGRVFETEEQARAWLARR